MALALRRRRFTLEEYDRMGETGILGDDPRIELIGGHIVVREPIGARHASVVDRLTRLWTSRLGERAIVRIQNPVQFPGLESELQPDVMLLLPREDFYAMSHPLAADVLLLIEVADTSVRLDRRVRIPLYARAAVRETWLCDLVSERVEIYREPAAGRYHRVVTLGRGDRVAPLELFDVAVLVEELIG